MADTKRGIRLRRENERTASVTRGTGGKEHRGEEKQIFRRGRRGVKSSCYAASVHEDLVTCREGKLGSFRRVGKI